MIELALLHDIENVAQKTWKEHEQTKPVELADKVNIALMVEEALTSLLRYSGPSQILKGIFSDRQWDLVVPSTCIAGINVFQEATHQIAETSGIRFISFGNHPEQTLIANPKEFRGLIVSGAHPENGSNLWEVKYVFNKFEVRKRERILKDGEWHTIGENLPLERADLRLVRNILENTKEVMAIFEERR